MANTLWIPRAVLYLEGCSERDPERQPHAHVPECGSERDPERDSQTDRGSLRLLHHSSCVLLVRDAGVHPSDSSRVQAEGPTSRSGGVDNDTCHPDRTFQQSESLVSPLAGAAGFLVGAAAVLCFGTQGRRYRSRSLADEGARPQDSNPIVNPQIAASRRVKGL